MYNPVGYIAALIREYGSGIPSAFNGTATIAERPTDQLFTRKTLANEETRTRNHFPARQQGDIRPILFMPKEIWLNFKLFRNMNDQHPPWAQAKQRYILEGHCREQGLAVKPMGKSPLEPRTSWWSSGLSAQVWDGRASNLLSIQKDLSCKCWSFEGTTKPAHLRKTYRMYDLMLRNSIYIYTKNIYIYTYTYGCGSKNGYGLFRSDPYLWIGLDHLRFDFVGVCKEVADLILSLSAQRKRFHLSPWSLNVCRDLPHSLWPMAFWANKTTMSTSLTLGPLGDWSPTMGASIQYVQ